MALIDFPEITFKRLTVQDFWLEGEQSRQVGYDGRAQVMFTENRAWVGSVGIAPHTGSDILKIRSFVTRLRGMANRFRLPLIQNGVAGVGLTGDAFLRAIGVPADVIARGCIPYSDGAFFSDGSGFALPENRPCSVARGAAAGQMSIVVRGFLAESAVPGMRFSINDFLYEVESNADGEITFSPPLREPVSAGDEARFDRPMVQVRLTSHSAMRLARKPGDYTDGLEFDVVEASER